MSAATSVAFAQNSPASSLPRILFYQGVLADMAGMPVPDGQYLVTMRLYDAAEGGKNLWEEQLNVGVYGGVFEAYLGMNRSLALPFDKAYWLAAQVQGEPEMEPRTLMVAAPYAFRSLVADSAAALAPGASGAVTSLNGIDGAVVLLGENGIRIHRSGDTIRIGAEVVGGAIAQPASVKSASRTETVPVKQVATEEISGVIVVALGGKDVQTEPPVAGVIQNLGSIVVNNPYVTPRSVVHVGVVEKDDDGASPSPEQALYLADVDNRGDGNFTLHLGMIPSVTNDRNFQQGDTIRIGYTVVNPSK